MDPYKTIKYLLGTEKAIRILESENKLVCIVDKKATKEQVRDSIEKAFKVKVTNVNTLITPQGKKKAYISLSPSTPAIDVATELGLM